MSKENGFMPKEEVIKALNRLSRPWYKAGETVPEFSVKEVSRTAGISASKIVDAITTKGGILFQADDSSTLTSVSVRDFEDPRKNAPYKRAVRLARYQSRAPGGGPVVKQRIVRSRLEKKLVELGRERLKITQDSIEQDDIKTRREEIKEKQAERSLWRLGVNKEEEFIPGLQAKQDIALVLQDLLKRKAANPIRYDETIRRLTKARVNGSTLTLFVPWGVRPTGIPRLETDVIKRLVSLESSLSSRDVNAQILIMPADVYATEVNNQVDPGQVMRYFAFIENIAKQNGFSVKPWSEIRSENLGIYQRRVEELTEEEITKFLSPANFQEALGAASRRSGYNTEEDVRKAAFAYLRERICEAEIIENTYQPIKVSVTSRNRDDGVDGNLPRIYIIPANLQFPWLK